MDITETRWLMHHFNADQLEQESITFTIELLKTLVVVALAFIIIPLAA